MKRELFRARKVKGLTQEQVAKATDIDRTAYCRIERGNRKPSVDVAIRIAGALGVKVEDIFLSGDVDEEHNDQSATLDHASNE